MKEKRSHEVIFRLTDREYKSLIEMVRGDPEARTKCGAKVNVSRYIRKCIFAPAGSMNDMKKEIKELRFQVRKIGVNINQVAKRINSGYLETNDIASLLESVGKVERLFGKLILKLGDEHGDHAHDEH